MREYEHLPVQFNERVNAYAIDMILVFLFILAAIFEDWTNVQAFLIVIIVYSITVIAPGLFWKGQSIGKRQIKTIVLTEDFKSLSFWKYALRMYFILFTGILSFLLFPLLEFYVVNKRSDRRALHDLLFKTRVVMKESKITG
jgi:uncharacterized RDD family membrane protein YckC